MTDDPHEPADPSAEERLSAAYERERSFAASLLETVPAIVVVMDRTGRIVRANDFLAKLAGATADELVGRDWFASFLPQRDQARVRTFYEEALGRGRVDAYRNPIVDHAGGEHEIEWSGRVVHDEAGAVVGLLSVGVDVSHTVEAARELRAQRELLSAIVSSTQDGFIAIDGSHRITLFNSGAERMFGYSVDEAVGRDVAILMPKPYSAEHQAYVERYEETGVPHAIGRVRVVQGRRRDGVLFPLELSVTRGSRDPESPARYTAFLRDISAKVALEARVREREALVAIGTTAAKFAHEVSNPLNGMLMSAQLAQRKIARGGTIDELPKYLERIETQVHRLAGLLREFRGLSPRQTFKLERVQPARLLGDMLAEHEEEYSAAGVRMVCDCPRNLPPVHVDREKINQVLLNLCKNAVESMPEGGALTLSAGLEGSQVTIRVADTGAGIPEGLAVFNPFITTKPEGTGLGLSVVRQIVLAHGGELRYESVVGEGTVFHLELPLDAPSQSSVNLPLMRH